MTSFQQLKSLAFHLPYCARYRMKEFQNLLLCQTNRKKIILYLISSQQNFEPAHEILVLIAYEIICSYGSDRSAHVHVQVSTCAYAKPCTVKPVLSGHSKRRLKIGFQDHCCLMQV